MALFKDGPCHGVITAPQLRVEFALHSRDVGAARRPARQASRRLRRRGARGAPPTLRRGRGPWGRGSRGGVCVGGGRQTARGAGAKASAATFRGSEAAPEGLAGTRERSERSRLWRSLQSSRLLAAGTGRQRPPSLGLTKRKHPSSSARSTRRWGPPKGAGVSRAGTPGGARQGRGTSCLGPRPGPIPESSKPLTWRASYPTASSEPSFHPSYPKRL